MQFEIKGNIDKPKILLIHPMYIDGRCFNTLIHYLSDDYCVIIPTLDGHGKDDSVFHSVKEEADLIIKYLHENAITELELIAGISLGGIIAFETFIRKQIKIKHALIDGAPFILLSSLRRKIMFHIFRMVTHSVKKHPQRTNIFDKKFPSYSRIMKEICLHITDESIKNLSEACYTYQLPKSIELEDETVTFLYGTAEKASMCLPALRKYTNTRLILREGYKHCEFISNYPREYAWLITCITLHHR